MTAATLLAEIEAWTAVSGVTPAGLGAVVLNHPGFVPLLRKRGLLRDETAALLRAFMARFAGPVPEGLITALRAMARAGDTWRPERHARLMKRLGYPQYLDEAAAAAEPAPVVASGPPAKPRVSAAVIRAAQIDGRDLPVFVTALIDMGLECWRDDRAAHGEEVG